MILMPADVVFTRGGSPWSQLVLNAQRSPGEKRTVVEHCGVISVGGTVAKAKIVESLPRGTVERDLAEYTAPWSDSVSVWRMPELTDAQRVAIVNAAKKFVGKKYGWPWFFAHGGDWLIGSKWYFRGMVRPGGNPDCSGVLGMAYIAITYRFVYGVRPEAIQPDDAWDHILANCPPWEYVGAI